MRLCYVCCLLIDIYNGLFVCVVCSCVWWFVFVKCRCCVGYVLCLSSPVLFVPCCVVCACMRLFVVFECALDCLIFCVCYVFGVCCFD